MEPAPPTRQSGYDPTHEQEVHDPKLGAVIKGPALSLP